MGEGNGAVQAVGRTFFHVTIVGYVLAGLAMFPAVILGINRNFFEYEIDRCSCVYADDASAATCVVGEDAVKVAIGWKGYTMEELKHTIGCDTATTEYLKDPEAYKKKLDEPQSFGAFDESYPLDGAFQKTDYPTQADEENGGAAAGGGVVAMQVVCSFFCILSYKMLKASFLTNGSHCSIGLGLMTRINFLVGLGLSAAILSFWWLIEGRFGDKDKALTQALEDVSTLWLCFHIVDYSSIRAALFVRETGKRRHRTDIVTLVCSENFLP